MIRLIAGGHILLSEICAFHGKVASAATSEWRTHPLFVSHQQAVTTPKIRADIQCGDAPASVLTA